MLNIREGKKSPKAMRDCLIGRKSFIANVPKNIRKLSLKIFTMKYYAYSTQNSSKSLVFLQFLRLPAVIAFTIWVSVMLLRSYKISVKYVSQGSSVYSIIEKGSL